MKTLIKITLLLFAITSAGCWNMYNDALDDVDDEYNFFLAAVNSDSFVSSFSINNEGTPTPVSKTTNFSSTSNYYYPDAHPSGNYLYVPNKSDDRLRIYNLDINGSFNYLSDIETGNAPYAVKVHPSGKYVYVSNSGDATGSISMYTINGDGTLITNGTPVLTYTNYRPIKMAFHPSGNFLYVAVVYPTSNYCRISSFSINSDGTLSSLQSLITIADIVTENSNDVIVHPNGQYLYVSISNGSIYKCNLNNDGTVDTVTNLSLSVSNNPYLAIHPSGNFLYIAATSFTSAFLINLSDGTLTANGVVSPTGISQHDIAIHPNGKYIYTTNLGSDYCYRYNISDNGTASLIDTIDCSGNGYLSSSSGLVLIRKKAD